MRNVKLEDPEAVARKILDYIRMAYKKVRLVHSDISEFNILMPTEEPVIIDVGQAVLLDHPLAQEWLERDVGNVVRYFKKLGVILDLKKELQEIRKE